MEAVLRNGYRGVSVTQDEEGRRVDWGNMPWDMLVGVALTVCCGCVSTDVGWRTRSCASNSIVGTGLHCAMFASPHFVVPYSCDYAVAATQYGPNGYCNAPTPDNATFL
jgi:hypothetical protein